MVKRSVSSPIIMAFVVTTAASLTLAVVTALALFLLMPGSIQAGSSAGPLLADANPPVVNLSNKSPNNAITYKEGDAAQKIGTNQAEVTDTDDNIQSLTVTITNRQDGTAEELSFTIPTKTDITGPASPVTSGSATFTGSSAPADYTDLLKSLKYRDTSDNPTTSPNRTIDVVATDVSGGSNGTPGRATVTLQAVNDGPTVTKPANASVAEDTPLPLPGWNITDPDIGSNSMQVRIETNHGTTSLSMIEGLAFTAGTNGSADFRFTGTLADVLAAVNSMSFQGTQDWSGNDATVKVTADDQGSTGSGGAHSDNKTITIAVTAVNDAPVINMSGATATYTENGAAVFVDTGATVTDVDSNNFNGGSLTVTGGANDLLTIVNEGTGNNQIGVSGSNLTFENHAIGTFSGGSGVPLVVTFNDNHANPDAASHLIHRIAYANSSDNPGASATLNFVLTDGDGGTSATTPKTVNIIPQNDPPTLGAGAANFPAINEDAGRPGGDPNPGALVSAILSGAQSDPDGPGSLQGIAATDQANGTGAWGSWQYSIDDGANWSDFPAVTGTAALLLASTDKVRFYPAENWNSGSGGPPTVTFRAWDQTNPGPGSHGSTADTTGAGAGTSGYSGSSATASILVNPVNDPPSVDLNGPNDQGIDMTRSFTEGGAAVGVSGGTATVTDLESDNVQSMTVTITNFQAGDLLTPTVHTAAVAENWDGGVGILYLTGAETPNKYQNLLHGIDYSNTSESPSIADRIITVVASDGANSPTATCTIQVTAVNDAPTFGGAVANLAPIAEDLSDAANSGTLVSALLGSSFTDVDGAGPGIAVVAVDNANGTWQFSTGGVWANFGTINPDVDARLLFSDGATTVRFLPNADWSGTADITYRAWDRSDGLANGATASTTVNGGISPLSSATATSSITVNPTNDAPSFTKGADQTVAEDAGAQTVVGWATGSSAGPANESGQSLTFVVTNDNNALFSAQPAITGGGGVLDTPGVNGIPGIPAVGTLTYTPAPNANGSATVTVVLWDGGGTANGGVDHSAAQTFVINVTPVNDPPTANSDSKTASLNSPVTFPAADLLANDSPGPANESGQTLVVIAVGSPSAQGGAVSLSGGSITYTPPAGFTGSDSFSYTIQDNGATNGALDPRPAVGTVNVTVLAQGGQAPSFTLGPNQRIDNACATIPNWATNISGQSITFLLSVNSPNPDLLRTLYILPDGTLNFCVQSEGLATVTVRLQDSSGATSAAQIFTIEGYNSEPGSLPSTPTPTPIPAPEGSAPPTATPTPASSGVGSMPFSMAAPYPLPAGVPAPTGGGMVDVFQGGPGMGTMSGFWNGSQVDVTVNNQGQPLLVDFQPMDAIPAGIPEGAAVVRAFTLDVYSYDPAANSATRLTPDQKETLADVVVRIALTDADLAALPGYPDNPDYSAFALQRVVLNPDGTVNRLESVPSSWSPDPAPLGSMVAVFKPRSVYVLAIGNPAPSHSIVLADARYFKETGYHINNDAFWDYFQKRGGLRTFGYPISREFKLNGFPVQMFQRAILQLMPSGSVATMNLLDGGMMPYTSMNFSSFPAQDEDMMRAAPTPSDPDYATKALEFIKANVPDEWEGQKVNFLSTFMGTVRYEDAFPNGGGEASLVPLLNLELWGLPTSKPALDPSNGSFVYQRFQRGIMHYDASTGATQGLLLADYLKSVMTGKNLPIDLEGQAKNSMFFKQYDGGMPGHVARSQELPGSDLTNAFEPEVVEAPVAGAFSVPPFLLLLAATSLLAAIPRIGRRRRN